MSTMISDIGYALAALTGAFSLVLSARALIQPLPAAIGFGVAPMPGLAPYMAIKGGRDLAVGLLLLSLLATRNASAVGIAMLAATAIPLVDGTIVLRTGGPRATAFGVHYATAAIMGAGAVLLLAG
jgi:hypothetical protein